MERLIEKGKVLNTLQGLLFKHRDDAQKYDGIHAAFAAVAALPTVDAVSVVRCKECKYCHAGYCEMNDDLIPHGNANREWGNWYCADGERSGE